MLCACTNDDSSTPQPPSHEECYTGDAYGELKSPYIVFDSSLEKLHKTTWHCIEFGSYPQAEVVASQYDYLEPYAVKDGDVVIDAKLFAALENADWNGRETEIDGVRYRRMKAEDAVRFAADSRGHYYWKNPDEYHYFRYEPVRWRILNIKGSKALLLADKALECNRFNSDATDVFWESSSLREWLNTDVYGCLFSETEKKSVMLTDVVNAANYYFGTYCGKDTKDYLFLLSESEVFCSELARNYGFYNSDGIDDPARRFRPTTYAACRGAWVSVVDSYKGNTFWFMRSTGYTPDNVTYVCEFGYLYNRGTLVTCSDAGIIPAVCIDLSTSKYKAAGTVCSDDIVQGN